ncbi:DUF4145 domain-containing protein [Gracilibacillus sp. YIM 98692]|uniref:DUF4145 domain-containing protein n=1 Tax=Gracilibacillus sp. YIM 98692 TaxID=2663532 RepID=UPI0013D57212|nr:DUF4145 domain-containing protein [Gracilibacillus sp. YIM 98692]
MKTEELNDINLLRKKVYCSKCNRNTNHGIIYKHKEEEYIPEGNFYILEEYYIIKCMGCENVAFASDYEDSNTARGWYDEDLNDWIEVDLLTVYPEKPKKSKRLPSRLIMKNYEFIPGEVRGLYKQILNAYKDESYLLCAIGLRMVIEAICKDLKIKTGLVYSEKEKKKIRRDNIEGKINGLAEKEVILDKQADILHQIRKLGNKSTHDFKVPKKNILDQAFYIIETIFHLVYEIRKFNILPNESKHK